MSQQHGHVWIFPNVYYRWLWTELGRALAERTGLKPLFIVPTQQDAAFYRSQFNREHDGEIVVRDNPYAIALAGGGRGLEAAATRARAIAIEKAYGLGIMRDLILPDRHLGRGFHHNGSGHPMSRISRRATPADALRACVASFDEIEALFRTHKPGLVISYGGGTGMFQKPVAVLCRHHGVSFRSLSHTRFADHYTWADDEFEGSSEFDEFYRNYRQPTADEIAETPRLVHPTGLYTTYAESLKRDLRWPRIAQLCGLQLAIHAYGRIRRYERARIGYYATSNIAYYVRRRLHWDRLMGGGAKTLAGLDAEEDRKIVFFPLQTDPEASLYGQSPGHNDQLATVREVALALPVDAVLVVKEHQVELGRRPVVFYRWLEKMPNVDMLRPDQPALEVIERAQLVVTINSSAGYEAAALGKPVIHFNDHGRLLAVPHVHHVSSFRDLDIVREILSDDDPQAAEERRRDGAKLYLALRDFGFDLGPMELHGREAAPTQAELDLFCDTLLATLPAARPKAASGV